MKNLYILLLLMVALIGCKKNDIPENGGHLYGCEIKPGWDNQFSSFVCQSLGENILQFKDFKELNEFIDKVDAIFEMYAVPSVDIFNTKECVSLYNKYRRHNVDNYAKDWFVTLAKLQLMANEEIQKGYQESLESGDYQMLRYSYFFLYNDKDLNDKKPYIAMENLKYACVVNIAGRVIVGDIEYNLNDCISFDDIPAKRK